MDRHHLLECILWPNGDGTFRKIVNSSKRIKELGIYNDFKLTIPMDHSTHMRLHWYFERGTENERVGEKNGMHGRSGDKHPMYGRTGEKNPMYGRTREKSPSWKGDSVAAAGAYRRAKELYKAGKISEDEFQPYRDALAEYMRLRKSTYSAI